MKKLRNLSELFADTRGNMLVFSTFALPVVIGATGLGVDSIQWTLSQKQMQRMADSAALAGSYAKAQGGNYQTSAQASLTRDNLLTMNQTPVIESAPTAGAYTGDARAVRVVLKTNNVMPFSSLFIANPPMITVEATAATLSNGEYCVISLEQAAVYGITMSGSAIVDLGCGMATNSPAASAVYAGGSSSINASPVAAVGGVPASSNYTPGTVLQPYSLKQPDPYKDLSDPVTPNPCWNDPNVKPNSPTVTLSPGCYKGMTLGGSAILSPGTYYIDGKFGGLKFGAQANVIATGVTFVLTSSTADSNPSSIAQVDMNGGAHIELTAPSTGTYAGLIMYQDRRATNTNGNKINGDSTSKYEGAFYFAAQGVEFQGNSTMDTKCIQFITRRITFTGNTGIQNQCDTNPATHAWAGLRVFLVS